MSALTTERTVPLSASTSRSMLSALERCVLLSVTASQWGNTRKVSTALIEVEADKTMIGVQKRLLDSRELEQIRSLDSQIRRWVQSQSLPGPFGPGVYMLPIVSVQMVERMFTEVFVPQRLALVDQFCAKYAQLVEESVVKLGAVYNERDYPPVEQVAKKFDLAWQYLSLSAPENLPPSLIEREQQRIQGQWQNALDEARGVLRTAMVEMVARATERLSGSEDGKKKIFKNTLLTNLEDFIASFDARNLTDDDELAKVVEQARSLVAGVDPEMLRKDDTVRAKVAEGFQQIEQQLGSMMTDAPIRQFFDD